MPNQREFNRNGLAVENSDNFDFKKLVGKILSLWHLFLISIIVFVGLAFLYIRYAEPSYKINSKITVQDDQSSSMLGGKGSSSSMMNFSDLLDLSSNVYNELDILTSNSLMTDVTNAMHLNITIYQKGRIKSDELFDESPFDVRVIQKKDSLQERKFNIEINNDKIHLTNSKEDVDVNVKFGQTVSLVQYDLVFIKKPEKWVNKLGYNLVIQSVDDKVSELSKDFQVDLTDKKSTTLALTLEYPNSKKGEAIITELMNLYLQANLKSKKETADSTLSFIDSRLNIVSAELTGVENNFSKYKQQNQLADIDEQGKALVANVSDYYNKLNTQQMQLALLKDVEKYITDTSNKRLIPNTLTVQDPVFLAAIATYNQVLMQRDQMALSYKDSNPIMKNIDANIENARGSLLASFNAYKNVLVASIVELKSKNSLLTNEVKNVPQKERIYLDYSREQDLKQQLYLYLLQKKEETAISKTSTLSTSRIIDRAKADYLPYKPKKAIIYLFGLIIGILAPYGYINARDMLNIKILKKEDIESNTSIPILGEIGNNVDNKSSLLIFKNSRSIVSEQFRSLRTNLQFVLNSKGSNVILITSSMSGEGKSFVSLNLGSVISLTGKKVLFMELDLRKPKLSLNFGLDNSFGFTNYMVSDDIKVDEIIKPIPASENCSIISSGPIPPNPAELLLNDRFGDLIAILRKMFDYIVIDSAPIGLVSDAQLIEKFCDVSLYVVRQEYTYKSQLNIINDLVDNGKFRRSYLVVNDIKAKKGGYYGYVYGQGYGYGYDGYGLEDNTSKRSKGKRSNQVEDN